MDLNSPAMPWPGVIRAHSNPGLSTCIDERRLRSDGLPLPVSLLEAEALRLAEWAVARHEPLVLCPADPLAPTAALIAAAVHVADMADHYRRSGRREGSSRRVAVVTNDFRLRGVYRGLGVRNPASHEVATLRDVVPAATLGRDGVVRVLAADPRTGWSTLFAPSVGALKSLPGIDLVIVVPPAGGVEEALSLGVPTVVVVTDPSDPALTRMAVTTPVFAWDQEDIGRAAAAGPLTPRLARRLEGDRCEVVGVPAHAVCENAALFWQDIGPLMRSGQRSAVARDLAREAFSLFYDLSGLALPLPDYEMLTTPVRVRLDAVGAATRWTRGETRDLYLPMVEAELRGLADALGDAPPKHDALVGLLGELLDDHRDVLLIARTAELARLHTADLSHRGVLARVRVTSFGALAGEAPADVAVLTGMAPTWARWVYRAGIASSLRVLGYTPEGPIESVARGYDEAGMVGEIVRLQSVRERWLAQSVTKDRTWSRLTGDPRRVSDDHGAAPGADTTKVTTRTFTPPDVPPGLWDGDGEWFADRGPAGVDGERSREVIARSGSSVVSAVRVTFDDGRWALLDRQGTVTRVGAGSGIPQATAVSSLKPGDHVLFLDGDGRKDLLAKVIEVAEEVPALAVAAAWTAYWRRVLITAYGRFGSYHALTAALAEQGCTVQTQTVRLWVIGITIGPENDDDVRRVGLVMDDATLRDGYAEVCRAFRSLRGAHVRLGKRLAEMAVRVGSAAATGRLDGDEVIDERSGLTVADFRESVEVLTVSEIEPVGDVPYVLVGRVNDEAMTEESDDDK